MNKKQSLTPAAIGEIIEDIREILNAEVAARNNLPERGICDGCDVDPSQSQGSGQYSRYLRSDK